MLNSRIKELRTLKGLSQVDLAHKLSVKKQTVSNWGNNNIQPSIEMLEKLSNFFCVSTDYLLGRDNTRRIDIDGLSNIELEHIQQIINDIRK